MRSGVSSAMRRPRPARCRAAAPRCRDAGRCRAAPCGGAPPCRNARRGCRDGAGADAAAHAGDGRQAAAAAAVGSRCLAAHERAEMALHDVARQRLGQVFRGAQPARDLAVELEIVHVADHEHAGIRLDHLRQLAERRQRLLLAADIDDQDARSGRSLLRPRWPRGCRRAGSRARAAASARPSRSAASLCGSATKASAAGRSCRAKLAGAGGRVGGMRRSSGISRPPASRRRSLTAPGAAPLPGTA